MYLGALFESVDPVSTPAVVVSDFPIAAVRMEDMAALPTPTKMTMALDNATALETAAATAAAVVVESGVPHVQIDVEAVAAATAAVAHVSERAEEVDNVSGGDINSVTIEADTPSIF
mmetsp:Transcript_19777/g.44915  ORF Transcript_19777/g.44915 Transcript_19777/m.44915 type:complete len:117 (-) Transcript_19777:164-514(-)